MNMVNPVPGVSVYLNADDISALDQARDHLNMLFESSGVEVPEVALALCGVKRLLDKIRNAQCSSKRREVIAQALKMAAE